MKRVSAPSAVTEVGVRQAVERQAAVLAGDAAERMQGGAAQDVAAAPEHVGDHAAGPFVVHLGGGAAVDLVQGAAVDAGGHAAVVARRVAAVEGDVDRARGGTWR